jgi:hypothetical protein
VFRWLARVAVVVVRAAAFSFAASVCSATPMPAPHANPTDVPPSTVAGHLMPLPMWALGLLALACSVAALVALRRHRTN